MCILSVRGSDGANMARTAAALGPLEQEAFETGAWAFGFRAAFDLLKGTLPLLYVGGRSEPSLYGGRVVAVLSRLLLEGRDGRCLTSRVVPSLTVSHFSLDPLLSNVGP